MKKIIVTKPSECPLKPSFWLAVKCELLTCLNCFDNNKFPPDCPLFENDYIVKRRSEDGVVTNPET